MVLYFAYSSKLTCHSLILQICYKFWFGPQYPSLQNDAKNYFAVNTIQMFY